MAVDRTVVVRLIANVGQYTAGMNAASAATTNVQRASVQADAAVRAAAARTAAASQKLSAVRRAEAAAAERVAAAERLLSEQRAAARTAATWVTNAERKLAELRAAGAPAAKVAAAERALAAAQQRSAVTATAAADAQTRLASAQGARTLATQRTATAEAELAAAQRAQAATAAQVARRQELVASGMKKLAVVGGIMALGIGAAVKTYAQFDQAMSAVRANLPGQAAQFGALEKAVREAGKASVFSSTDAAHAAEELAKAGQNVDQIIGGSLIGSLNLAAAGEISMADAATYMSQAMAQFHLDASKATHIADVFANGALSSTADVSTLAQALSQGGLSASQMGLSFEQTVGILSMFDQNALKGSDAGTSLKTMLMRMTPTSKEASAAMEQLGLNFFDATGKFVGMESVAQQLHDKVKPLSDEQKNLALNTIFGADATRAATIVMKDGAAGIRKWTEDVNKGNTAAVVAAQKQNNLRGDVEKLKGALEDLAIGSGKGADGPLRKLTQWAETFTSLIGAMPDSVKSTGLAMGTIALGAGLAVAGLVKLASGMKNTAKEIRGGRDALKAWSLAAGGNGGVFSGLAARVKALGTAFGQMSTKMKVAAGVGAAALLTFVAAITTTGEAQENYGRSGAQMFKDINGMKGGVLNVTDLFRNLQVALDTDKTYSFAEGVKSITNNADGASRAIGSLVTLGGNLGTGAASAGDAARQRLRALSDELARLIDTGDPKQMGQAKAAFESLSKQWVAAGGNVKDLGTYTTSYSDAVIRATEANKGAAGAAKQNAVEMEKQKAAAEAADQALKNLGSTLLGQQDASYGYAQAVADANDAVKTNAHTLDMNTKAGRDNQQKLSALANAAIKNAGAIKDQTGSYTQANDALKVGRQQYISTATAMGMSRAQAERFADQLFVLKDVPMDKLVAGLSNVTSATSDLGEQVYKINGTKIEVPVSLPNSEQMVQVLASIKGSTLSLDKQSITIPSYTPGADKTVDAMLKMGLAKKNANGSVTIQSKALGADVTEQWLLKIGRAAKDADGKVVIIPSNIPGGAGVLSMIGKIHGAQISANGKTVTITSSAPQSADTVAKLKKIKGVQVDTNGKKVTINTSAPGAVDAANKILAAGSAADKVNGKKATVWLYEKTFKSVTLSSQVDGRDPLKNAKATGGAIYGPGSGTSDDIPAWLSNGEHVLTASDVRKAGGQGAIYRMRAAIQAGQLRFARGGAVQAFADGGSVSSWSPDISGIMSIISSLPSSDDAIQAWTQIKPAADALAKVSRDLRAARVKLAEDSRKKHVSKSTLIADQNRITRLIDQQTAAQTKLNKAHREYNQMAASVKKPLSTQFRLAAIGRNVTSAQFLADIKKIQARGFPNLARTLLEQGDDEAAKVAHSMASANIGTLRSTEQNLKRSDSLNDQRQALLDKLTGADKAARAERIKAANDARLNELALRSANAAWSNGGGVRVTAPAPFDYKQMAAAVSQVQLTAPQAQQPIVLHVDGKEFARVVTGHQQTQASYGSTQPGVW